MSMSLQTPTFNLKAVVRETGLSADTLRAWERRYGVPQPGRSDRRQRLYSRQDVDALKWLVARQAEGISISRAVEMWKRTQIVDESAPLDHPTPANGNSSDELSLEWVEACLAFNGDRAETILARAFGIYPPLQVCEDVIRRGIVDIGHRWCVGDATVHQEHFATELAIRQIERIIGATPAPWREGRIVVGCVAHEYHSFAPLLFTLMLRWRGWDVVYLGADVPVDWFGATKVLARPSLVVLSAQRLVTAGRLLDSARALGETETPLAFGGRVFNLVPSLRTRVKGYFLGKTLEDGISTVAAVHRGQLVPPAVSPLPDHFVTALEHYRNRQSFIEAAVDQELDAQPGDAAEILRENLDLARSVDAALAFGNLSVLEGEIDFVRGLLEHRDIPMSVMDRYLTAYRRAARTHLDERGRLVLDWLASRTNDPPEH